MEATFVWLLAAILVLPAAETERMRCGTKADCPSGAYCFKDECPRCICPKGQHVVKLFMDGQLYPLCEDKQPTTQNPLVGNPCDVNTGRPCPYNSQCADSGACACLAGLIPHADRSYCRRAMFGEECDAQHPCEGYRGLDCDVTSGTCGCGPAFHRPNEWTQFILQRWDYSLVEEGEQKCVARAVGEPCRADAECGAVGGSGAVCSPCGFCRCRQQQHVPDVLGTKCGPGQGFGDACSLHSASVCDGTQGLQCGDVCDLYSYSYSTKLCTCSQMHDRHGVTECRPKVLDSPCSTDLDCYPIMGGYGYCNSSRCTVDVNTISKDYEPHLVGRHCDIDLADVKVTGPEHQYDDVTQGRHNTSGPGPPLTMDLPDDTRHLPDDTQTYDKRQGNSTVRELETLDSSSADISSRSRSSSSGDRSLPLSMWTHGCVLLAVLTLPWKQALPW